MDSGGKKDTTSEETPPIEANDSNADSKSEKPPNEVEKTQDEETISNAGSNSARPQSIEGRKQETSSNAGLDSARPHSKEGQKQETSSNAGSNSARPYSKEGEKQEDAISNAGLNLEKTSHKEGKAQDEDSKSETLSEKSERKSEDTESHRLPYLETKEETRYREDSRMYSPDDALTIDDFMENLQQDKLQLSQEVQQWREKYDLEVNMAETDNILSGNPSLTGLGLTDEEQSIARIVVDSKMRELKKMSTQELVDYVRLSSY